MTRKISTPHISNDFVSVELYTPEGTLCELWHDVRAGDIASAPLVGAPTAEELCLLHKQLAKGIEIHKKLREMLDAVEPVEVPDARGD